MYLKLSNKYCVLSLGAYALNVQEDAYLHIIDKLKENNMQIEEEEVMDDNTIVLTVNIE